MCFNICVVFITAVSKYIYTINTAKRPTAELGNTVSVRCSSTLSDNAKDQQQDNLSLRCVTHLYTV